MAVREEMAELLATAARGASVAMVRLAQTEVWEQMAKRVASGAMAGLVVAGDLFQAMAARVVMPVKAARVARAATELPVPTVRMPRVPLPLPVAKMAVLVEMARLAVRVASGAWEARHWERAWLEPTELMAMEAMGAQQAMAVRVASEETD